MALIVAVEGLPGTGKTTVIGLMTEELRQKGFRVGVSDHETIGYAPALRAAARTHPFGHPARILLFWVLRLQQYEVMEKLMADADVIFLDHFWGSTLVYDVYNHGLPRDVVEWIRQFLKRQPDVTLFFDAPLKVAQERKETKTADDPAFAERVAAAYQRLAQELSWIRVDAAREPKDVKERCMEIILAKLEKA